MTELLGCIQAGSALSVNQSMDEDEHKSLHSAGSHY